MTREIYKAGGVVGAVFHRQAALVNATLDDGCHLVAGKRGAFTNQEERSMMLDGGVPFLLAATLTERGAQHEPASNRTAKAVHGHPVTGQNTQSATPCAKAACDLVLAAAQPR